MAPRKKPAAVKILKGTFRPDREPDAPWIAEAEMPDPPDYLTDVALAEWHRLVPKLFRQGVICDADAGALAIHCMTFAEMVDAEALFADARNRQPKSRGLIRKSKNNEVLFNPLWNIVRSARREYWKSCAVLGLSPTDRGKVSLNPPKPQADKEDPATRFFGS
jgi:P27 family predicted phage terminase small subunit